MSNRLKRYGCLGAAVIAFGTILVAVFYGVLGNAIYDLLRSLAPSWAPLAKQVLLDFNANLILGNLVWIFPLIILVLLFILGFRMWQIRGHRKQGQQFRQSAQSVPGRFIGRKKEIRRFRELLSQRRGPRVFFIHGVPGIGKSWLARQLLNDPAVGKRVKALVDFREWTYDPINLLDEIRLQLGKEHFRGFSNKLAAYNEFRSQQPVDHPTPGEVERRVLLRSKQDDLVTEFFVELSVVARRWGIIMALDNWQKIVPSELEVWFQSKMLPALRSKGMEGIFTIVASWELPSWLDTFVYPCHLLEFSVEETREYLMTEVGESIRDEIVQKVHEVTKGEPQGVGFAATLIAVSLKKGQPITPELITSDPHLKQQMVKKFLFEHILSVVTPDVEQAILYCAVPRWFDASILKALERRENGSLQLLEQLTKFESFVDPRLPSGYVYHEVVRDLLLQKWLQDDETRYYDLNVIALQYFEEKMNTESGKKHNDYALEYLYHQLVLNKDRGVELFCNLFDQASTLYQVGFCEALLREVQGQSLDFKERQWVRYYEGAFAGWQRKAPEEARDKLRQLYAEVNLTPQLKAKVVRSLGWQNLELGEQTQALVFFEESKRIFDQLGDTEEVAEVLSSMGEVYEYQGRFDSAVASMEQAIQLTQSQKLLGMTLNRVGVIYRRNGQPDKAIEYLLRSLEIWEKLGIKYILGSTRLAIGDAYRGESNWDEADKWYKLSLEVLQELEQAGVASYYPNLIFDIGGATAATGRVHLVRRELREAEKAFRKSIELFKSIDSDFGVGFAVGLLGRVHEASSEMAEAENCYREGLEIARRTKFQRHIAEELVYLCDLFYETRRVDEPDSRAMFIEAENLTREHNFAEWLSWILCIDANIALDHNDPNMAFQKFAEACEQSIVYNHYLLEETMFRIIARFEALRQQGQFAICKNLCDYLMEYWKSRNLGGKEQQSRSGRIFSPTKLGLLSEVVSNLAKSIPESA